MSATPRDQVIRRCLHQLEDAPDALRKLADLYETRAPAPAARFRRWADAIENVRVLVPDELQTLLDRIDRSE